MSQRPMTASARRPIVTFAFAGLAAAALLMGVGPSQPDLATLIGMVGEKVDNLDERHRKTLLELGEARKEVREARDQVLALRDEMKGLKGDIAQIKAMLGSMTRPTLPPPAPTFTVPADPMASPDALLAGLRERYVKAFSGVVADNDLARRDRMREIERWTRDINRELRGKVKWLARIESVEPATPDPSSATPAARDAAFLVSYTVLDATSRAPVSGVQSVPVPSHIGNKLRDHPAGTIAEIGAFMTSAVTFNESRTEAGIFGIPVMVGPYVEYGINVEWTSVEPVRGSAKPDRPPTDPAR